MRTRPLFGLSSLSPKKDIDYRRMNDPNLCVVRSVTTVMGSPQVKRLCRSLVSHREGPLRQELIFTGIISHATPLLPFSFSQCFYLSIG